MRHNLRCVIIVGAWFPRQIPNVLRYSCMFIEPGVLHDVVGILGNPTPTDSTVPFLLFPPLRSLRRCVLALNCLLIRVDSRMAFSFHVSRITFHFP